MEYLQKDNGLDAAKFMHEIWPHMIQLHEVRNIKVVKQNIHDAPPHSLKDSNLNPNVKTIKRVGLCSLTPSTSKVEGHVGAP